MDPRVNELEERLRSERPAGGSADAAARFAERAEREGLADVGYGFVDSPLGRLLVAGTEQGLVRIAYPERPLESVIGELAERVSPRVLEAPARVDDARRQLDDYFAGRRARFELPIDWRLARGFMERVLRFTATVPAGEVVTYREVAEAAGSPRAARAAGNALGANRIPIVIPCHRVVHSGGGLGGYTGSLERKLDLLRLEGWPGVGSAR